MKAAFVVHTGDICGRGGMVGHLMMMNHLTMDRPMHYCIGNHDLINGSCGEEVFEALFGPCWYSFEAGGLADAPSKLCEADIVYALSKPAEKGADFSWVKPGKVAWDWWNCFDNLGEAKGCTTAGYKRFIDFAAKTGVEYVILDEGWSEKLNIWKFHPNVDVPEIIRYGNEKGVGIILWLAWAQAYDCEAKVAEHFSKLGAKGFKVDFMDRADARVAQFLEKFASECAKTKMLVDYHGVYRPTGLHRQYPNVINYEGVHGLEQTKWFKNGYDFMDNDIKVFFCRMTAGPMDYTPGAMDNYPIGKYKPTGVHPGVGYRYPAKLY